VYDRWEPRLTDEAKRAFGEVKRILKDENGRIPSAFLSLYLSISPAETLPAMIEELENLRSLHAAFRDTRYFSDEGWALFEEVAPHVRDALLFLEREGFSSHWRDSVAPGVREAIERIRPDLPRYYVIGKVERMLDRDVASDEITVYLLRYAKPHGIRITGTRYLTDASYPFRIVLRNAVHEMLHPPYDLDSDPELARAIDSLRKDPFVAEAYEERDRSFGYNSFTGLIEEDVVQALEQLIVEEFGIAQDAWARWEQADEGLHVFAAALYAVLKEREFGAGEDGPAVRDVLVEEIRDGALRPGRIRRVYESFYAGAPDGS